MRFSVDSKLSITLISGKNFIGTLIEPYTTEQCVLRLENNIVRVIQNPIYNIIFIDVLQTEQQKPKEENVAIVEPLELPGFIAEEKDRVITLAELHKERAKLERESVQKMLTSNKKVGGQEISYGYPTEFRRRKSATNQNIPKHPKKKT